jgi:hypothetical protein
MKLKKTKEHQRDQQPSHGDNKMGAWSNLRYRLGDIGGPRVGLQKYWARVRSDLWMMPLVDCQMSRIQAMGINKDKEQRSFGTLDSS